MKKRIANIYTLCTVVALALTACTDKYSIQGSALQNLYSANMAFLKSPDGSQSTVDSCEIVHGNFKMNGPLDSIQCVNLVIGDITMPVVLEQGDIRVRMDNQQLRIEGTPLNEDFYKFLNTRDSLTMLLMELPNKESHMILEGFDQDDIFKQLGEEEASLRGQMDRLETNFVVDNFNNVLGLTWFLHMCSDVSSRFGYPTTTPQIEEIYGRAPEEFRNNPRIVDFMNAVNHQ